MIKNPLDKEMFCLICFYGLIFGGSIGGGAGYDAGYFGLLAAKSIGAAFAGAATGFGVGVCSFSTCALSVFYCCDERATDDERVPLNDEGYSSDGSVRSAGRIAQEIILMYP